MQRECILVVEDEQSFKEVVTLSSSDAYDVKQATTGREALRIVRREPVAVVVLDYPRAPSAAAAKRPKSKLVCDLAENAVEVVTGGTIAPTSGA